MPSSVLFGEEWQIFSGSGLCNILMIINANERERNTDSEKKQIM
jgi:hypothetical protein